MQLSSGEYLSDLYIYIFCLLFCPFQILKKSVHLNLWEKYLGCLLKRCISVSQF